MIARLVYNCGIVDHHCLNFLFIIHTPKVNILYTSTIVL